ncbi:AtpZ/AtpI family protein [Candidatus Caldatribacterium sp.]|uniref:AtpZ/AtpI family protein n=1 Tax=Candidatus Caldatribacterium sp. TaxID=2282143 RepID=UPI0029938531|nr:AtpZ/AtpI family protein [Candidatus Caldatribacterium sp.]MDW8081461.1 AtpZ/AtpI family protein [Candidatus Calescibacterium sp.]
MKRKFDEGNVWKILGEVWDLAWVTIAPILFGVFLGQYLDRKYPLGFSWTLSLLALGATLGLYNLYETLMRVSREVERKKGDNDHNHP